MTAEAKAERREVIANNKAWDAARPVRRQWLTAFLARRTAPKDAPQWIAATLASCAHDVRRAMEDGHQTALELLGLAGDPPWQPYSGTPNPVVDAAAKASPARATMLTLGLLLGGLEATPHPQHLAVRHRRPAGVLHRPAALGLPAVRRRAARPRPYARALRPSPTPSRTPRPTSDAVSPDGDEAVSD